MRKILIFFLLFAPFNILIAQQLVLIPQAGGEKFRIIQKSTDPAYSKNYFTATSISLGARLHYTSKNSHGAFVGFHVNELASGGSVPGLLQRYEIGYQFSGNRMYAGNKKDEKPLGSKGLFLQFQPSLGFVIQKSRRNDTDSSGPYMYNAKSNRVTPGILANLGLMLGRDARPVMNVNFYYVHGFSQIYEGYFHSTTGPYQQTSKGSSFGLNFGIPVSIFKRK